MAFKLTAGVKRAGWVLGVGDALRAMGNALAVMMLPIVSAVGPAPPLFRIRVGPRVSYLEIRKHDATRCTRGRWERLDSADTPSNAKEWAKLARFWAFFSQEHTAGRPVWSWVDDNGKDLNRCHTRAHADRLTPSPAGGPGRGRKCKDLPGGELTVGYTPAAGRRLSRPTERVTRLNK